MSGKIFLVMQQGGSSTELYASTFDTEDAAEEYVHDCRRSTYDAIGPFEVDTPIIESTMLATLNEVCAEVAMFSVSTELCAHYMEWTDEDKCPED